MTNSIFKIREPKNIMINKRTENKLSNKINTNVIDKIFTFWEPEESIPGYLKLCMKTWTKFLPDKEIIILNYKNLNKWLGKQLYNEILYSDFSLPKQADAIRCAVLCRGGGFGLMLILY